MPIFLGWLGAVAGWFFGIFGAWLSAKVALIAALGTVLLALTAGLFLLVKGLVFGLVGIVPYEPFVMAFWACWPSNAETCITAAFGCDAAIFLYSWKMRFIGMVTSA